MKVFAVRLMLVIGLVLPGVAVLAQDSTPEVTVVPTLPPVIDPVPEVPVPEQPPPLFQAPMPAEVLNVFILGLFAAFSTAIASPLTQPIANVLKRFFPNRLSGNIPNLIVAVVLSIITWGAAAIGLSQQVDMAYQLIYAVLPILMGVGGNFVGNKLVYTAARELNMPIAGFARTPPSTSRSVHVTQNFSAGIDPADARGVLERTLRR